ncbi:MAG: LysR family transcriptional regulator [Shimia sp.]|uniref:LysR family transcriptional regulator n=1 Tax=Shimia sp. TaxID=1954381 RepID=UPI0019E62AD6|nr:LysR family transcriptional regulator [Shimia sp.]MBE1293696.1 LysR family transcriptional regulator [Paracoccaceae bacterium]MBO6899437.1 LysR family transcriptional regulator [Shimia sp.]
MPYLESLRVFVRVVELGSITSGGRDLRLTPAVASNRVKELESRLGVRLFNRTTRNLSPTEVGKVFYDHARKVIETLDEAEAVVAGFSDKPRGTIRVTAPLGVGRRIVAPLIPAFADKYPNVDVQLRLSDRKVDLFEDGLDVAFVLGELKDSNLKLRKIADCDRVLVAAPEYLEAHGTPQTPDDLLGDHNCLLLRFPRSPEYFWTLQTENGLRKIEAKGRYDADDGDVLTQWALEGAGIANKPRFDVAQHLKSGALVEVLSDTPPLPASFGCLYPHRKLQDPKIRLFVDFVASESKQRIAQL